MKKKKEKQTKELKNSGIKGEKRLKKRPGSS